MQKIAIAGMAIALVAATGFAESAEARCMRHGITTTCRHMARIHHSRYLAMHRHAYPAYGYGYGSPYGYSYGYGSSYSPYDNTSSVSSSEQAVQGTGN
jgi:hypothetical protein